MRAIFISYRRSDAEGQAGRLFKDLTERFGPDAVFMDVADIEPGRDFRRVIDQQVASCGVLLAVMGRNWAGAPDENGRRRLDDPGDFVRLETAAALKRDIPLIPVLVQGAAMPKAEQLPPEIADLAYRNGVELSHARWDSDVALLEKALEPYVGTPAAARAPAPGPAPAPAADGPPRASRSRTWGLGGAAFAIAVGIATAVGVFRPHDEPARHPGLGGASAPTVPSAASTAYAAAAGDDAAWFAGAPTRTVSFAAHVAATNPCTGQRLETTGTSTVTLHTRGDEVLVEHRYAARGPGYEVAQGGRARLPRSDTYDVPVAGRWTVDGGNFTTSGVVHIEVGQGRLASHLQKFEQRCQAR